MDDTLPLLLWRLGRAASAHNREYGGTVLAWTLYAYDGNWHRELQTVYSNSKPTSRDARRVWERQAHLWRRSRERANAREVEALK